MGLKVLARKALSKRAFWPSRDNKHQRGVKSNNNVVLEAISQVNIDEVVVSKTNEEGAVRMRIVVKKQDLKQMLKVMRGGDDHDEYIVDQYQYHHGPSLSSSSAEQRLNLLRRRHVVRLNASKRGHKVAWFPALQSIPEEL